MLGALKQKALWLDCQRAWNGQAPSSDEFRNFLEEFKTHCFTFSSFSEHCYATGVWSPNIRQ